MPGRRGRSTQHRGRGNALTPTDKEHIFQVYTAVEVGNVAGTAERCGVSPRTVHNVIAEFKNRPAPVKQAEIELVKRIQAKTIAKAEEVLDSITGVDLESGYFEVLDKDGKVVGRKYYGPQATQKALAFGIITDKARVYNDLSRAMASDEKSGQLMVPQELGALKDLILTKLSSLKILQADFKQDVPGLFERTQDLLERVEASKATEVIVYDFDNPTEKV